MRSWMLGLAFGVLALTAMAALGAAVNPTDDDAGSGRDAGDEPATAVPITPGSYEGRLTHAIDTEDHYSFQATEGDVVVASATPEATEPALQLVGPDGAERTSAVWAIDDVWLLIPETGTWTLRVEGQPAEQGATLDYTFELTRSNDYFTYERTIEDGWGTVEVSVDRPGQLMGYVRGASPQDPGEAYANFGAVGVQADEPDGGHHASWNAHGYGHGARGEGSAFTLVDETLPGDQQVADTVTSFSPWHTSQVFTSYTDAKMRITAMEAPSEHGLRIALASTTPFQIEQASGDDVALWTTSDNDESTLGQAPGVTATRSSTMNLSVDGDLRGYFYTYDTRGEITAPGGDCYTVDGGELFADPAAGSWEFELGPDQAVGYTERVYLVAADVPDLGVFDWGSFGPVSALEDPGCV